jgi:hypothetical protein
LLLIHGLPLSARAHARRIAASLLERHAGRVATRARCVWVWVVAVGTCDDERAGGELVGPVEGPSCAAGEVGGAVDAARRRGSGVREVGARSARVRESAPLDGCDELGVVAAELGGSLLWVREVVG